MHPASRSTFLLLLGSLLLLGACNSNSQPDASRFMKMEIFMKVAATRQDVGVVRTALQQSPGIVTTRFLSRNDALRTFKCLFADQPQLTASVGAGDLPESFRVTVERRVQAERLGRRVSAMGGVENVEIQGARPIDASRSATTPTRRSWVTQTPGQPRCPGV